MKIIEKIKFKIIERLNKNEDYCWSNLVNWAMGFKSFWSLFFKSHSDNDYKDQGCRKYNPDTPYAYCNKCEKTGRFYNDKQVETIVRFIK